MFNFLWNVAAFIMALGVLITVHEFGHFWVARRCGVCVQRFSLGFGKTLCRWRDKQGTEFIIALIPLGGYVKMLDERVEPILAEQRHQAFNYKPIWQRAAIVAAGPLFNFLFTFLLYWLIFVLGVPGIRPIVDAVAPHSLVAKAGITSGMEIKAVDSVETPDWDAVRLALLGKIGDDELRLTVLTPNSSERSQKRLDLSQWHYEPDKQDPVLTLGIIPLAPRIETTLAQVQADSPASRAGLRSGDTILTVNQHALTSWQPFVQQIRDHPGQALQLTVKRKNSVISLALTPEARSDKPSEGFVGLTPVVTPIADKYKIVYRYGPLDAVAKAMSKTWQLIRLTVSTLGKLLTGDIKLNNLSGPISIAQGAGISAGYGLIYYLMFLALISVNLGIINLFPLPVLDGGHLLFLTIEKIKGAPMSERVQDFSYRIGSVLLVLLMGLALFNDFSRL